jgi:phosphate/sulfate permease
MVISIVISVLASVLSGTLLFFMQRYFKRRDKKEDAEVARRREKDKLLFKSIKAVGDLAAANTIALKHGHANGECEKALADFDKVDKEIFDFLVSNE